MRDTIMIFAMIASLIATWHVAHWVMRLIVTEYGIIGGLVACGVIYVTSLMMDHFYERDGAALSPKISKELDVRLPNQILMKLSCREPSSIPEEFKARTPKTRPSQDCRLRAVRRCDVTRDTSDWRLPRRIRSAFTRSKVKLAHSAGDQTDSYPVLRIDRMRDPVRQSPWF